MTISEKTRTTRVDRWTNLRRAWEAKLAKAANKNDTAVAKAMIAEAQKNIERLESLDKRDSKEAKSERVSPPHVSKKQKGKEDTSTIGP